MPRYDFRCHECTTVFEEQRRMSQADVPAVCPDCGSENTYKVLSQVAVVGGSSRPQADAAPATRAGCGCGSACGCGLH